MKIYYIKYPIILIFICLIINCGVNFNDNPAILEVINDNGTVVLDTYNGKVIGKLEGVEWRSEKDFLEKVKQIVAKAKADKVAYVILENSNIKIWYQSSDGDKYLNEEIQQVSESFEKMGSILKKERYRVTS